MRIETIKKLEDFKVIDLYNSGKSVVEIMAISKLGEGSISKYLHENNVTFRKAAKRESLREKPIIGQKFGQYSVISEKTKVGSEVTGNPEYRNLYWEVQCECGEISWRSASCLRTGKTNSCKACSQLSGNIDAYINSKFKIIVNNILTRKKVSVLDFDITPEYLQKLYDVSHICSLSGLDITFNSKLKVKSNDLSIDRIDSSIGYIKGNVQLVHKEINMMKGTLSQDRFIELCRKVTENN